MAEDGAEPACKQAATVVERFMAHANASDKTRLKVNQALEIIGRSIESIGLEHLAISFNGGKDCQVMLILILAYIHKHNLHPTDRLLSVYIKAKDSFAEVDEFVEKCAATYNLEVDVQECGMKESLTNFLEQNPQVRGVFVGIRRDDPHAQSLEYIQPTDAGWPDFIRVHPMLEFDYGDIWAFLRLAHVEYCLLYDQGYTSLGGRQSTVRNPALETKSGFEPAYMLDEYSKERLGRR